MKSDKKIAVVDFGGQYAHLIASRVRRIGAYTEIISNEESIETYQSYAGIILSGGPSSVYEYGAPTLPKDFLDLKLPVLGICYGHQLLMQKLGGSVVPSPNKEYGPATLKVDSQTQSLLTKGLSRESIMWMSHGDEVESLPEGFEVLGSSADCQYAFVANEEKKWYGIQFHPEVTHSVEGEILLRNFVSLCQVSNTWSIDLFLTEEIERLQKQIPLDQNVFLLVSGGVDSSVAYLLLAKALGKHRVKGLLVDTGFMRKNEVSDLKNHLSKMDFDLNVWDASEEFYTKLRGKTEPEEKRKVVGDLFIKVQAEAISTFQLDPKSWVLGQGTIYPDTIESGGTKHSHKIKTHHNRVPAIQKMIEEGKVVEPISQLYKDEVRDLGRRLGLPEVWVERHPFPGPGLVVRMISSLESPGNEILPKVESFLKSMGSKHSAGILPIQSVGVQGDQRSYAHACVLNDLNLDWKAYDSVSIAITNKIKEVNRVVFMPGLATLPKEFFYTKIELDRHTSDLLREADFLVNQHLFTAGIHREIWQMPVVLVPVGSKAKTYGIVLRPVESTEAMTANFYPMDQNILKAMTKDLHKLSEISAVFYDLTHKPPGTIEWE
ncbi:GMP synthase [Leptospira ryugenii]|uniref:GMP synthase (glutamine-hydrolyzing) n=1 Tax=Leptospira ryugenii TaxID=1917863 RepID=A0A2P2DWJ5_9LEPT|nr:glutamine-hydrolyzing GMP synthase [Leptospira ryugenii]GBF49011.1 GMP synthase [Leptospira ryugenii]